ncbi:MAG: hypothetical protein R3F34_19300 [Planctomycetota bacterium]
MSDERSRPDDLESAVLAWIAQRHGLALDPSSLRVEHRESTGAGRSTSFRSDSTTWDRPPLEGPTITSPELEFGAGSLLWLVAGEPACLELFAYGATLPGRLTPFGLSS